MQTFIEENCYANCVSSAQHVIYLMYFFCTKRKVDELLSRYRSTRTRTLDSKRNIFYARSKRNSISFPQRHKSSCSSHRRAMKNSRQNARRGARKHRTRAETASHYIRVLARTTASPFRTVIRYRDSVSQFRDRSINCDPSLHCAAAT